jgi:hypothetical protein
MGGLNMANINFQIEEFFRRDIYKFLELIPARHYEVSVMPIPETGETSISLIFYGGHLIQEEAYRLRISYADIIGVIKPDGYLDVMYLQYLLDTFLTMSKEYRRNLK